jgi:hypothetical protein
MDATSSIRPAPELATDAFACLQRLAPKYVWWKTPEEAMLFPDRVAAQIMNIGIWEDITALIEAAGEDYLRNVLQASEIGQLNPRSWHYWHYRLGLAQPGSSPVPPMPVRKIA